MKSIWELKFGTSEVTYEKVIIYVRFLTNDIFVWFNGLRYYL